jgi:hypothetical protein
MTKNMMKKIFSFMMTGMKMEIYSKVILILLSLSNNTNDNILF